MKWSSANVYLSLKPATNGTSTSTASSAPSVPILAPKAQKELDAGVEAFRGKDMVQARKHFEKALSMAPGNADVQYLMGALELQEKNIPAGQEHLEKAVQLFPNHVRALELLGELYCSQGHPERAVPLLEKAVSLDEVSWKAHWKLGSAYLQSNDPAKAQQQSERAIALGKGEAGVAQVLDAAALADLGKLDAAESVLSAQKCRRRLRSAARNFNVENFDVVRAGNRRACSRRRAQRFLRAPSGTRRRRQAGRAIDGQS
jgi:Tfp pilus assembly protein PilF